MSIVESRLAAGRVQLDHERGRVAVRGVAQRVADVRRHRRVDLAGRGQDDDRAGRGRAGRGRGDREEAHAGEERPTSRTDEERDGGSVGSSADHRSAGRAARNSNAIRLHVSSRSATASTSPAAHERPAQLLGLPDRDRAAGRVRLVDEAHVDPADRASCRRSGGRRTGTPARSSTASSSSHSRRSAVDRSPSSATVLGVDVAADADRVPVVEAGVAAGPRPSHQEPARRRPAGPGTG